MVVLTGCRADVTVAVRATADGDGDVSATVSLDEEAAARVPELAAQLRVSDLRRAGWRIEGPAPAGGGRTEVRAVKAFATPAEANRAIRELSGAGGPLGGLRFEQDRSLLETTTSLTGTVDLSGGLPAFGDERLTATLGGLPLGVDPAQLEKELGRPLADVFGFDVVARFPGSTEVSKARLGERVVVSASAEQRQVSRIAFGAVSLLCALALVAVVARRLIRA